LGTQGNRKTQFQRSGIIWREIERFSATLEASLHDITALNENLEDILAWSGLLDEYICISNANVHFRTAQSKTCRVLVPHPPEFRWMMEGESSPGSWEQNYIVRVATEIGPRHWPC
jgi:hypothetical protein